MPEETKKPDICPLVTENELAERLHISKNTFQHKRKDLEKVIPPIRIGKNITRYRLSDVLNFLERGGFDDE